MITNGFETLNIERRNAEIETTLYYYQGNVKPFSAFRIEKIQQHIQEQTNLRIQVDVRILYIIKMKNDSNDINARLCQLLNAKQLQVLNFTHSPTFWVVPRFGTLSPWASKALDIVNGCGLCAVENIEQAFVYTIDSIKQLEHHQLKTIAEKFYDRMTETICFDFKDLNKLFTFNHPRRETVISLSQGLDALIAMDKKLGLSLSLQEMEFLYDSYNKINRSPTLSELMMFAQVNSEHCRHKIFNATWEKNKKQLPHSLFDMIRYTYAQHPQKILSAYTDNGAVLEGVVESLFFADFHSKIYRWHEEPAHLGIKVETHNHPTAISPFAGAATGAGGEIRDEGATGRGAKPKAGLSGFSVSHLHLPNYGHEWEVNLGYPTHIATSLEIMLEGPIGAAAYNNEFGRPNLLGYFRTFQYQDYGYHKPIMLAGGMALIRSSSVKKKQIQADAKLIVLGGPAMLIGLGGGAASSVAAGCHALDLDFKSVQRANPEIQRRCQEVINACWSLGEQNPIRSIHDVGAGGISNALSELVNDHGLGGTFELRAIPCTDLSMSPMEIWCNEAQERYVLAIQDEHFATFAKIAERERCPFAMIGRATSQKDLVLSDAYFNQNPVNIPLSLLFGNTPKIQKEYHDVEPKKWEALQNLRSIGQCIELVLQFPAVASKSFLITIGDRSVTGLVARDQMVGPWQVPVADVAVTLSSYKGYRGEAMAMGERTPLAVMNAKSAARMAVAEAITNIAAASINQLSDIKLSANWMAACTEPAEESALYDAVQAVGLELCPALGISIPVGKDSLSMQMQWKQDHQLLKISSPVSLIISAFAPVNDVRKTLTPQLVTQKGDTCLLLIDLGKSKNRLGGSILAQVHQQIGDNPPDLDDPTLLKDFFNAIQKLQEEKLILAYHDRSDGGLITTLCEMSFASHTGITVSLNCPHAETIPYLFNEELGAVIQIFEKNWNQVLAIFEEYGLNDALVKIGCPNEGDDIVIHCKETLIFQESRVALQRLWSATSFHLQAIRDNSDCAKQEYDLLLDSQYPGLQSFETFEFSEKLVAPFIQKQIKPKIAILREQGVNGHVEMAAAFDAAGFKSVDVHMTDILSGVVTLSDFVGLAACGGFSYGDVLGAGKGWANSILFNSLAHDQFSRFFERKNTFTLGVCNGCQMLSQLRDLIPGSELWPTFKRNTSDQFEARVCLVTIQKTPSIFFTGMENSQLPVPVAHGEGRVEFTDPLHCQRVISENLVPLQFTNAYGQITANYPHNPNGSELGITALTNKDGRITLMMPHPERVFRTVQHSWYPEHWQEKSPWFRLFANARIWVN